MNPPRAASRLGRVSDRFDSGRIEAFSDGVLAIAITLLVLEISVPPEAFEHLGRAILDLWPSYLAYVTSFATIGAVWLVHHGIFRQMSHADHVVVRLNLLLLMIAAFLPFPTRLLAEAIEDADAERTAVLFYGGVLVALLSTLAALSRYVASRPELLHDPGSADDLRRLAATMAPGLGLYAAALGAAVLAPRVAAFAFLAIALLAVFRVPGDEPDATLK